MERYSLRPVTTADEPALLDLFQSVFGHPRSSDEWRWKFQASQTLLPDPWRAPQPGADSLVAVDPSGQIVGHAGALVLPGVSGDEDIPIVQVCDVMIHPAHRGGIGRANLFTVLLRDLLEGLAERLPKAFRYGFPGEGPFRVGERARVYERIETALETQVGGSRFGPLTPWRVAPLAWRPETPDQLKLDQLWRRLRPQYTLGLARDAAYLRWRYRDHPNRDYQLLGVWRFGRWLGWVVLREEGARWIVVDALLPRANLRRALEAVAARWGGEREVWVWLPASWRADFPAAASRPTPVVTAQMVWRGARPTAAVAAALYYSMGDVDIF